MTGSLADEQRQFLFALADDEFITANRLSRWVGSGPTLEEDNVLSSFVQDELGHARLWLDVVAESTDESVTVLSQNRPAAERRHSLLVEPDHAGFADTIVRNLLYDYAEEQLVRSILDADDETLADRARVVLEEEHFHREHAEQWLDVLSTTEEGREKLRDALDDNLPRARDFFAFEAGFDRRLQDAGVVSSNFDELEQVWIDNVVAAIEAVSLEYDAGEVEDVLSQPPEINGRKGEHTETLDEILDNLYPTREELYPDHIDMDADIRYEEKIGLE